MKLVDKSILFISVKFFNYETLIKKKLESLGAKVDYFDERPSNSFWSKAIIRLKKDFYSYRINKYFHQIIEKIKDNEYDYFFLIKGEATPKFFIDYLRNKNPNIKLIYYTFDSFVNNSNGLELIKYFDDVFTFDNIDAAKYQLKFRPLFFADDYSELYSQTSSCSYDLTFIGTAHSDRYLISENAKEWCIKNSLNPFSFYFSPSKFLFHFKKQTDKNFHKFDFDKISFNSLTHSEIIEIYKKSKVILDINHPGQVGLTMRTFETLGAGRKLITTNAEVKSYPFYNENNIWILDRNNLIFDVAFFKSPFIKLDQNLYNSMSINGWLEDVFNLSKHNYWKLNHEN